MTLRGMSWIFVVPENALVALEKILCAILSHRINCEHIYQHLLQFIEIHKLRNGLA